jgi:hypothetical protein
MDFKYDSKTRTWTRSETNTYQYRILAFNLVIPIENYNYTLTNYVKPTDQATTPSLCSPISYYHEVLPMVKNLVPYEPPTFEPLVYCPNAPSPVRPWTSYVCNPLRGTWGAWTMTTYEQFMMDLHEYVIIAQQNDIQKVKNFCQKISIKMSDLLGKDGKEIVQSFKE